MNKNPPGRTALLATLVALTVASLSAGAAELGSRVSELLDYAREHNPELAMRQQEAQAAHAEVGAASALPDPSFQLEMMDFGNDAPLPELAGTTRYLITQQLPYFGKRGLRGRIAEQQAAQRDAASDLAWLQVEDGLRRAYARYYQAAGQARILRETQDLYSALEKQVLNRYGVGLVPQQDALRVQSEITAIKIDLVEAQQRRREASAQLNALLPRAADALLAEPLDLELPHALPSLDELSQRLLANAPELARDQANIRQQQNARDLTWRDRYPDFMLGLRDNRPRNGGQSWDLMVQVNIPLQQDARRSRETAAERRLEAARQGEAATRARLLGWLGGSYATYVGNRDKASLLRDTLLPQAHATLRSAESGYATGQADFTTLIEAQRQILRTRLKLLDAEVASALQLAELQRLTGAPL